MASIATSKLDFVTLWQQFFFVGILLNFNKTYKPFSICTSVRLFFLGQWAYTFAFATVQTVKLISMAFLEEELLKDNYISIPLRYNDVGHAMLSLSVNEKTATFLLDTGATSDVLDIEFATELGFELIPTGQKGGGAGGLIHDVYALSVVELFYGETKLSVNPFYSMDFISIKQALKAKGVAEEFQGILGFGFLKNNRCIIDYGDDKIYVKPIEVPVKNS